MSDLVERLRRCRADMMGTRDDDTFFACHDAADKLERLTERAERAEAERDALRVDAERYRRLRKESVHGWNLLGHYTQEALDAAIDAAMTKETP